MSKIISVFEKLNLVEKANKDSDTNSNISKAYPEKQDKAENIKKDEEGIESNSDVNNSKYVGKDQEKKILDKIDSGEKRNLTVKEIYEKYGIENSDINTIFMLGNFIKALPESLPKEVRKKSIIGIIKSSDINLDKLISDGKNRLSSLKNFSKSHHDSIEKEIGNYKKEIMHLNELISNYKKEIESNENVLKEQDNTIKYEIEKIDNIINFFNND